MSEKKHSHDHLNVDDALVASEAFLFKYKNALIAAVAAVVIIVCGYLGYRHFIGEPKEQKAAEAIARGEQYFGNDDFRTALEGDSLGYAGFLKIADTYSGTRTANLAHAYAGLCYAQLGKYKEALAELDRFSADDYMVAPAIIGTMGNCYAQLGQPDKAAATLLKAAEKANSNVLSPVYLLQAGELLEKQGKNAEAVEAYRKIKNRYANSVQAMDIDKYIDRASIK